MTARTSSETKNGTEEARDEDLSQVVTHLIEETRMVVPGQQALLGFQLVVAFNPGFRDLAPFERGLHLVAIIATVVAVAVIMTPAAYHRQAEKHRISTRFVRIASHLLLMSMVPLTLAFGLETYIVSAAILENRVASALLAAGVVGVFGTFWFVLPRARRLQALLDRER